MKVSKVMFFEDDREFIEFAINPDLIIKKDSRYPYTDFEWTSTYENARNEGTLFVIKDPRSRIIRNGEISYRLLTKRVCGVISIDDWNIIKSKFE